ncbi:ZDHHC13, partial [Symbiodinium sp. KB8]
VATFDAEDVELLGPSLPCFTSSLKKYLQPLLGASACRQRLLCNGTVLFDDCSYEDIGMPEELQVLVVPYTGENPRELMTAVKEGNECEVRRALEKGIDPNIEELLSEHDFQAFTPLYCAALSGRLDLVKLLLDAGADKDQGGFSTPLVVASQKGHLDIVEYLIEAGADTQKAAEFGMTPINSASVGQQTPVMQYLLRVNREKQFASLCLGEEDNF